jgi:hypothetical protein
MEVITMLNLSNRNKKFVPYLAAAVLGIMVLGLTQIAFAQGRGGHDGPGGSNHQQYRDTRYQHNHDYPARGQAIRSLPSGHREVFYRGVRYKFHGGVWYRPSGGRFLIVAPPIGLFVPFLPPFYSTIWFGGMPYYYANEVYYTPTVGGYTVVDPPQGEVSQTAPSTGQTQTGQLFVYPRQGQSQKLQADDRYACHNWAVDQTNYDPTKTPVGVGASETQSDNYRRALAACLDGRGYTVK